MDMQSEDQSMEDVMDAPMDNGTSAHQLPAFAQPPALAQPLGTQYLSSTSNNAGVLTELDRLYAQMRAVIAGAAQPREPFRDIHVKVHIRKPDRDSWAYLGRAIVSQEISGQSSRVVVKSASSHKILTVFGEGAALQAERRNNFVVISCVEGGRVVSWSLNALNHSETMRLLASIELACYACKQAMADPASHTTFRRRVTRLIKDDRRRRHKRRKDQDAMVAAFARTGIEEEAEGEDDQPPPAAAPPIAEPMPIPVPAPIPMPIPEPAPASGLMFPGFAPSQ